MSCYAQWSLRSSPPLEKGREMVRPETKFVQKTVESGCLEDPEVVDRSFPRYRTHLPIPLCVVWQWHSSVVQVHKETVLISHDKAFSFEDRVARPSLCWWDSFLFEASTRELSLSTRQAELTWELETMFYRLNLNFKLIRSGGVGDRVRNISSI